MSLVLPFLFNACGESFLGGAAFESAGLSCPSSKPQDVLAKSFATFSNQKLQFGKSNVSQKLTSGQSLAVIVDHACIRSDLLSAKGVYSKSSTMLSQKLGATGRHMGKAKSIRTRIEAFRYSPSSEESTEQLGEAIAADPCVIGAGPNLIYSKEALSQSFDDPSVSQQEHLVSIDAENAYQKFYDEQWGMDKVDDPEQSVIVAIVDTGLYGDHPDLEAQLWEGPEGGYGVDATTLESETVNYFPGDTDPDFGHGTHVAGIIGATGNNAIGVVGVMPYQSRLMGVNVFRTFNTQSGPVYGADTVDISNGVIWATDNGADVINMSLGRIVQKVGSQFPENDDPTYRSILDYAVNKGVFVVVAAGNHSSGFPSSVRMGLGFTSFPAHYGSAIAGMITVGSVNALGGAKSWFSYWSPELVEISAPGAANAMDSGILSTRKVGTNGELYVRLQGTSMAAPVVAGAAALTIGIYRNTFGIRPRPSEVERLIELSAVKTEALKTWFKDGNTLNLNSLAEVIRSEYPEVIGLPARSRTLASCPE